MGAAAVLLSLGTISGCIAVACVAIAFATDNWVEYNVDRVGILSTVQATENINSPEFADVVRDMNRSQIYFSRTVGLWRICFAPEIPYGLTYYRSPTDTSCVNVDYPKDLDSNMDAWQRARLHLKRTILAFFIAAFAMELLSFLIGVFGCWRRSPGLLITTGTFMLLAFFLDAGALAIWHGVDYMETEKMVYPQYTFYPSWPPVLQRNYYRIYSWSFMLAWIGCGFALITALFLYAGAGSLRAERQREKERNAQYIVPAYGHYGEKNAPYYAHAYQGPYYYYNTNTYRY